jgi:carboxylate-amine ligase
LSKSNGWPAPLPKPRPRRNVHVDSGEERIMANVVIPRPSLTLGVEEEYMIIDPVTRELRSYITQFLEEGDRSLLRESQLKPELYQSVVEVGTPVCHNVQELRGEVVAMRRGVTDLAGKKGLAIAAAGTHPFSEWMQQEVTPFTRYYGVMEDMQYLARRLLIFGLHVHVGIEDREFLIDAMNVSRYMLPHILALSTSSPFWLGRKTGLKSMRSVIFEDFPRTGIPDHFGSYAEFEQFVQTLIRTNCIDDGKRIWWDVRPHPFFNTLEFRICDMCTRVEEVICVAALFQALIAKLWKMRRDNITFRIYRRALVTENKWRAVRYGLDGKLVDFGKQVELPARDLIRELIEWFLDDVLDELGSRAAVHYAFKIMENGTSADRQLATFERTGDLKAVVDQLIAETQEGVS